MKPFFDKIFKNISELIKSIIANAEKHLWQIIIIILIIFFSIYYNKELIEIANWFKSLTIAISEEKKSSNTLRNISLSIFGILALILAIWRSIIANNQWKVSLKQAETSEKQWRTAEEGQQTDRYQKAAQMLASENETERIGAIYALRDLVLANAEVYYITVMDLFCTFLRRPWYEAAKDNLVKKLEEELKQKNDAIKNEDIDEQEKQSKLKQNSEEYNKKIDEVNPSFPPDRQLICEIAFATLRDFNTYPDHKNIEGKWKPNLEKAEFFFLQKPTNTKLDHYNFSKINAKLTKFMGADLSNADLSNADLSYADRPNADFIKL